MSEKLTKAERLILVNQYEILALLDPKNAKDHKRNADRLAQGYLRQFGALGYIEDEFPASVHQTVYDVLDMYRSLIFAASRDPDMAALEDKVSFQGFDGNNEAEHMGYAQHVLDVEGLFAESQTTAGYNSHCPMLDQYAVMLERWRASSDRLKLTKADVERIIS